MSNTGSSQAATLGSENHYDFNKSAGANLVSKGLMYKQGVNAGQRHSSLRYYFWEQMIFGALYVGINIYTLYRLDILNVLLLAYPLLVVTGLMVGGLIHDNLISKSTP